MFCAKCGKEVSGDARFCPDCGADLGGTQASAGGNSETSVGMSANVAGLLCYVLGWVTGIIFLVLEKKNASVRFHAWQSIMTFGVLSVVALIVSIPSIIGAVLSVVVSVIAFVLWIILMVQAGNGKKWKVPWAGDWAEKQVQKG